MRSGLCFIIGMLVVATSGCLYHGGYPYYGPGPAMPQQPWPTYPPGAYPSYGPAPTFGNPTPINGDPYSQPGSIQPTPTDPGAPDTYKGGGNNAPTFNPTPNNNTVPNPSDDTSPTSSNSPGLTPTKTSRVRNNNSTSLDESSRLPRHFSNEAAVEEEPDFHPPVIQASGVDDGQLQANRQDISVKPYGHGARYEWLKGIVEFDDSGKTWVIMYDDNPKSSDKLGGEVSLADHPKLQNLQDGELVQIEGVLDPQLTDWRGKAVYRIKNLRKISDR